MTSGEYGLCRPFLSDCDFLTKRSRVMLVGGYLRDYNQLMNGPACKALLRHGFPPTIRLNILLFSSLPAQTSVLLAFVQSACVDCNSAVLLADAQRAVTSSAHMEPSYSGGSYRIQFCLCRDSGEALVDALSRLAALF